MSDSKKFTGTYKIFSTSNGQTLDIKSRKGSGALEYKVDKLKLKASFTEDILTKGPTAPGSKLSVNQGDFNLHYDLSSSAKENPLSGDYTMRTKIEGKDLSLKAAWQQRDNAVNLTTVYNFDKDNKIEATYAVKSQNVGLTATHRTSSGYTLAWAYQHPNETWNASVAKSVKAVNYKFTYDSKNNGEIKIAKNPLTLVVRTPLPIGGNKAKCDVNATFEKSYTF